MQPLPFDHCEDHLSNHKNKIISLRCNRASWDVRLKFSSNQYRLGEGWRDLVIECNVEEKDACLFHFMRGTNNPLIYSVQIFKA